MMPCPTCDGAGSFDVSDFETCFGPAGYRCETYNGSGEVRTESGAIVSEAGEEQMDKELMARNAQYILDLKRDAERYRALRDNPRARIYIDMVGGCDLKGERLDAAIDELRGAT